MTTLSNSTVSLQQTSVFDYDDESGAAHSATTWFVPAHIITPSNPIWIDVNGPSASVEANNSLYGRRIGEMGPRVGDGGKLEGVCKFFFPREEHCPYITQSGLCRSWAVTGGFGKGLFRSTYSPQQWSDLVESPACTAGLMYILSLALRFSL